MSKPGPKVAVRFWGTRGSTPAPGPRTVRYGGNTSCTEVRVGPLLIILDCGTGLRELGNSLLKEFKGRPIAGHIFVGHTHWDHIQGFPFFAPFYGARNRFSIYSARGAHRSLDRVFGGAMSADYFPVPMSSLASRPRFVEMRGPVRLPGAEVLFQHLNHPGGAVGFRIEAAGRIVTYLSDHETFCRLGGPGAGNRRKDREIAEFARGSDLLICEAQYTEAEYRDKRGWGHSTFDDVVARGVEAGAKRLALFHHDPTHTDAMMDRFLRLCRAKIRAAGSSMICLAAREGESVKL